MLKRFLVLAIVILSVYAKAAVDLRMLEAPTLILPSEKIVRNILNRVLEPQKMKDQDNFFSLNFVQPQSTFHHAVHNKEFDTLQAINEDGTLAHLNSIGETKLLIEEFFRRFNAFVKKTNHQANLYQVYLMLRKTSGELSRSSGVYHQMPTTRLHATSHFRNKVPAMLYFILKNSQIISNNKTWEGFDGVTSLPYSYLNADDNVASEEEMKMAGIGEMEDVSGLSTNEPSDIKEATDSDISAEFAGFWARRPFTNPKQIAEALQRLNPGATNASLPLAYAELLINLAGFPMSAQLTSPPLQDDSGREPVRSPESIPVIGTNAIWVKYERLGNGEYVTRLLEDHTKWAIFPFPERGGPTAIQNPKVVKSQPTSRRNSNAGKADEDVVGDVPMGESIEIDQFAL